MKKMKFQKYLAKIFIFIKSADSEELQKRKVFFTITISIHI